MSFSQMEWLLPTYQRLTNSYQQQRLPAAILLTGVNGVGKMALAQELSGLLLCQLPKPEGEYLTPCGTCKSCHLYHAGTHPDTLLLQPSDNGVIPVDAIRGLIQATAQATHQSGNRVVIIGSAEAMNSNAANALLKTLEEPPLGSYFILTTSQPGRLIPTILSRCQQYVISANSQQAMNWLQDQQLTATAGLLAQFQNAPLALQDFINSEDNAAMLQFQSAYQHWVEGDLSALQQMQQVIMIAPEKRIDWLITRVALEIKQSTMALAHCLIPWYQSLLTSRRLLSQSGFNQVLQIEKLISNGAQIDRGSTI